MPAYFIHIENLNFVECKISTPYDKVCMYLGQTKTVGLDILCVFFLHITLYFPLSHRENTGTSCNLKRIKNWFSFSVWSDNRVVNKVLTVVLVFVGLSFAG